MSRVRRFAGPVVLVAVPLAPLYIVPEGFRDLLRSVVITNNTLAAESVFLGVNSLAPVALVFRENVNGRSTDQFDYELVLNSGDELWGQTEGGSSPVVIAVSGTRYPD